jgi:hypothetical protein
VTERATKKRRRDGAKGPPPWSDLRLDALPTGPEKERVLLAQRCFEAGDYAQMRTIADELSKSENDDVRKAAAALRSRIGVDRVQAMILGACALFFVIVALRYLL